MSGQMFFGATPSSHTPSEHNDRSIRHFFPADRFQSQLAGTFEVANSIPVWRLADAVDTIVTAGIELPAYLERVSGTISIDTMYLLQDAGVVGAGNARIGILSELIEPTTVPLAQTPTVESIAIPAEGVGVILLRTITPALLPVDANDFELIITFRRDATDVLDTFSNRLRLVAVSGLITLDQ